MKRKEVSSDSDCTFFQPDSNLHGGGGSAATASRQRPQGSKHTKEERRVTTLRESAAIAQATATKAMADATLKKTKMMEDANMLMLMTHPTDRSISESAAKYLKLRQDEELEKLETRLAEERARKANVQQTPLPIPVESTDMLQARAAAAIRQPTRRHQIQRSPFDHGHDGMGRDAEAAGVGVSQHEGSDPQGRGLSNLEGGHDSPHSQHDIFFQVDGSAGAQERDVMGQGDFDDNEHDEDELNAPDEGIGSEVFPIGTQAWTPEHEEEEDYEGQQNQYKYSQHGHGDEEQPEDIEYEVHREPQDRYEGGAGESDHEHGRQGSRENAFPMTGDEEEDGRGNFVNLSGSPEKEGSGGRFVGRGRSSFQLPKDRAADLCSIGCGLGFRQHGQQSMTSNPFLSQGSQHLQTSSVRSSHQNPALQQHRQSYTPPHRASLGSCSSRKSRSLQSMDENLAVAIDDYENSEEGGSDANRSLDLNAKLY